MGVYINPNVMMVEAVKFGIAVPPTSIAASAVSPWYSIQKKRRIAGGCMVECASDGTILTAQLEQATDSSGTSAKVLGSAVTKTASGQQSLLAIAEVVEDDIDSNDDFLYWRVKLSHDEGSALNGGAFAMNVPYSRTGTSIPNTNYKECTTSTTTAAPTTTTTAAATTTTTAAATTTTTAAPTTTTTAAPTTTTTA